MALGPAKAPRGPPVMTDPQGGQVSQSRAGMGSTPDRILSKLCFLVESGTFLNGERKVLPFSGRNGKQRSQRSSETL